MKNIKKMAIALTAASLILPGVASAAVVKKPCLSYANATSKTSPFPLQNVRMPAGGAAYYAPTYAQAQVNFELRYKNRTPSVVTWNRIYDLPDPNHLENMVYTEIISKIRQDKIPVCPDFQWGSICKTCTPF